MKIGVYIIFDFFKNFLIRRLTDFVPGGNDTNYEMLNLENKDGQPQKPGQPGQGPNKELVI